MEKLKKRWGITSNWQIIVIFIVFAITGSSSLFVTKPVLSFFGIIKENFDYSIFYYCLKILLVFPVYQVLLIFFGFIFGQFQFFWNFEKKMLSRMGFKRFFE